MARVEQSSISNLALGGIGLFACVIVGTLGLLLYKVRHRHAPVEVVAKVESASKQKVIVAESDENNPPMIRVAARTPVPEPEMKEAPAVAAPEVATPAVETPAPETEAAPVEKQIIKVADAQGNLVAVQPAVNDDLIGEISGMSYTTKKLLASGMDPNNPAKAEAVKPVKKPEVKKPVVPVVPPKTPVKPPVVPAKPATPPLPPLPAAGDGKIDFTKLPVYVLNDGRRIRAVISRELNGIVSVRNEAGTEISFKKSDVKEVIKK